MVAEKEDTNISPSCPAFLLNEVLLILQTGSALPTDISRPHSHERHLRRSDPVAKGNLLLWCCQKAAVPSCPGSGKAGRLRGEAATQCLGLPGLQAELKGMQAGAIA